MSMRRFHLTGASGRTAPTEPLARSIGGAGFFVLSFGTIVGSGWVVASGEWIAASGPGGAIVAFIAAGLLLAVVAAAYAELVARLPRAGGEFVFVLNGLGRTAGFLTGWFITLYIIAFTAFEAVALAWFLEMLFPILSQAKVLYKILGYNVTIFNLGLGIIGAGALTWLNCRGANSSVRVQLAVTYSFIATSIIILAMGASQVHIRNIEPLFSVASGESTSVPLGILWTFATALLFLTGFQTAANAIEERSINTSMRSVARAMVWSVLVATFFYCFIIAEISSLVPWRELVSKPLPAAAAFESVLPGGLATKIVLVAAAISLVKTWNALHLSASRLLLAQAREGLLPSALSYVDARHGVPVRAVILVGSCTVGWLFLGKGAIIPIINVSTICVTIALVLSLLALARLRKSQLVEPDFVLPGGKLVLTLAIGVTALAAVMSVCMLFTATHGPPIEIVIICVWTVLGLCVGYLTERARRLRPIPNDIGAPAVNPSTKGLRGHRRP